MLKLSINFGSLKGIPSQRSMFDHEQVISLNGIILLKAAHDLKPVHYSNDFWSMFDVM